MCCVKQITFFRFDYIGRFYFDMFWHLFNEKIGFLREILSLAKKWVIHLCETKDSTIGEKRNTINIDTKLSS